MSELTPTPSEPQSIPAPPSLPFRVPADYYAAPVEGRPVFPRWVPIGCGTAAVFLVVLLFIGGAFAAHGGLGRIMDIFLGLMQNEMVTMYGDDVPADARKSLEAELTGLRANIRSERVAVPRLEPVMGALREAIADRKLTNAEVTDLRKKIREANTATPAKR